MRREHWSTWYAGSEAQWQAMPIAERDVLSFKATGCTVAYPTWEAPVDCVHGPCRVKRGEIHFMVLVNQGLRYERQSGWLRFVTDRTRLAKIYRAVRHECRKQNTYDMFKAAWPALVYGGIQA